MRQFRFLFSAAFSTAILLPALISAAGLVPCGEQGNPCQLCHIFILVNNAWSWGLTYLVFPFATLMFVAGGFLFFFAGGNPRTLDTAKTLLTNTVIGVAIIFGSFLIVNTLFAMMGVANLNLGLTSLDKWFQINCPLQ